MGFNNYSKNCVAFLIAFFIATNYIYQIVNPFIYLIVLFLFIYGKQPLKIYINKTTVIFLPYVLMLLIGSISSPKGSDGVVYFITNCFMFLLLCRSNCNYAWIEYLPKYLLILLGGHTLFVLLYPISPSVVQNVCAKILKADSYAKNIYEWNYNGIDCGITGVQSLAAFYITVFMGILFAMYFSNYIQKKWQKHLVIVLFLVAFAGVLLTSKRGVMLANVVAITILPLALSSNLSKRFKYILNITIILILGLIILNKFFPEALTIFERFEKQKDISTGRFDIYALVLSDISSNLIFGKGNLAVSAILDGNYAHNIFIQLLYENGILGVTSFVIFAGYVYIKTIKDYRNSVSDKSKYYIAISLYFQTYFICYGMVGNPLFDYTILFTYFCMIVIGNYGKEANALE